MSKVRTMCGATIVLVAVLTACQRGTLQTANSPSTDMLTDRQISSLTAKKIFFGHQSVGNDIVQGIRDWESADTRLKLNIVKSQEPQTVASPAFIEFEIGQNGDPQSKVDAFVAIVDKGLGAQGGVALFKLCYVDIGVSTDVNKLFASYRVAVDTLKHKYPSLRIVHVTLPLTTVEPAGKAWIKTLLGRVTLRDINWKRNQFNSLMRQTYAGTDPLFDLAEVESTHGDGSKSFVMSHDERVYTLAPEYTTDGGHLNESGRRVAAVGLLRVLSEL